MTKQTCVAARQECLMDYIALLNSLVIISMSQGRRYKARSNLFEKTVVGIRQEKKSRFKKPDFFKIMLRTTAFTNQTNYDTRSTPKI